MGERGGFASREAGGFYLFSGLISQNGSTQTFVSKTIGLGPSCAIESTGAFPGARR